MRSSEAKPDKALPEANTCPMVLFLPTIHRNYEVFCNAMDTALACAKHGFGKMWGLWKCSNVLEFIFSYLFCLDRTGLAYFVWIVLVFRTVKELGSYVLRTIKGDNIPLKLNVQEQIFTCYQCAGANKMLSVQSSTGERRVLIRWERNAPKRTTGSHLFFFLDQTIFSLVVLDNTGLNWWCYLRMHLC